MKYYTLDDIMELDPCHTRLGLETYMKGRKRISLSGILNSRASDDDKVWLVVRLLPIDKAAEFAKWCADSVSHINNDRASRAASAAEYAARVAAGKDVWAARAASAARYAASAAAGKDVWAASDASAAAVWAAAYAAKAADAAIDADAARYARHAAGAADDVDKAAWGVYGKARKNQVNQLKLIVKENNL